MKTPIVLFCKSFRNDVIRIKKLINSIQKFNKDNIPLFVSTPREDKIIFDKHLDPNSYIWVDDMAICQSNPCFKNAYLENIKGHTSQQIIKAEFWRLGFCENYLCLDSDAEFIKDFYQSNFLNSDGSPYIIMHSAKDFIHEMEIYGKKNIITDFRRESSELKQFFGRVGPDYDFGPSPFIWSGKVWEFLSREILEPKKINIWEAIKMLPMEMRWYGETLLTSKVISINPKQPLFKVYHYEWQYKKEFEDIANNNLLKKDYLGVIQQSNWNRSLDSDFGQKPLKSKIWRKIKTFIKKSSHV